MGPSRLFLLLMQLLYTINLRVHHTVSLEHNNSMQERQQQPHRVVPAWPSSILQNDKSVTGATLQRSRPFKQSKTGEKNKCSWSASLLTTGLLQRNRQQVRSAMRAGCKTSINFTYLLHGERHADAVLLNQHSPRVVVMAAQTGGDVGSKSVKQIKPLRSTDTPNPSALHQKHPPARFYKHQSWSAKTSHNCTGKIMSCQFDQLLQPYRLCSWNPPALI